MKITFDTPAGPVTLCAVNGAVTGVIFGIDDEPDTYDENDGRVLMLARAQLKEYFDGCRRVFELPVVINTTGFRSRIYEALVKIPYGTTVTYGQLAVLAGYSPAHSRAAGGALHHNPLPILLPCHRVIGSSGKLVGFNGGVDIKEVLLKLEKK